MIISKAIPIKFWQSGSTYNQGIDSVAGVMDAIWNQKWNADDSIPLQFYDTVEKDYRLRCYNEAGVLLDEITFDRELLNDIYIYSKTFSFGTDFSVTADTIHLKIVEVYAAITGELTDTMETCSGDVLFVDAANNRDIAGSLNDTIETGTGSVVTSQTDLFGRSTSGSGEAAACSLLYTLYWTSTSAWGTGVTMYTNATLTTALTGFNFIANSAGEIFNINSSTGVVGSSTGIFC